MSYDPVRGARGQVICVEFAIATDEKPKLASFSKTGKRCATQVHFSASTVRHLRPPKPRTIHQILLRICDPGRPSCGFTPLSRSSIRLSSLLNEHA